ncbi:MAG: PhoD-like phosphatase N-terminal domain-containing protein, partial [Janthinobacterium sp.]
MDSQRRIFLLSAARIGALAAAGSALSGSSASAATRLNGTGYPFALGVASGSPLPDAVVLWTRICYDPLQSAATPAIALNVRWEVADDE